LGQADPARTAPGFFWEKGRTLTMLRWETGKRFGGRERWRFPFCGGVDLWILCWDRFGIFGGFAEKWAGGGIYPPAMFWPGSNSLGQHCGGFFREARCPRCSDVVKSWGPFANIVKNFAAFCRPVRNPIWALTGKGRTHFAGGKKIQQTGALGKIGLGIGAGKQGVLVYKDTGFPFGRKTFFDFCRIFGSVAIGARTDWEPKNPACFPRGNEKSFKGKLGERAKVEDRGKAIVVTTVSGDQGRFFFPGSRPPLQTKRINFRFFKVVQGDVLWRRFARKLLGLGTVPHCAWGFRNCAGAFYPVPVGQLFCWRTSRAPTYCGGKPPHEKADADGGDSCGGGETKVLWPVVRDWKKKFSRKLYKRDGGVGRLPVHDKIELRIGIGKKLKRWRLKETGGSPPQGFRIFCKPFVGFRHFWLDGHFAQGGTWKGFAKWPGRVWTASGGAYCFSARLL